ncbi:MAG: hypothetical protein WDZ49_10825 [Litorilinea sp.]
MAQSFSSGQATAPPSGNPGADFELGSPPPPVAPRPPTKRARSWFWPGFVAGFLLLTILSLGGLAMLAGITPMSLGDLQSQGNGWTPPPAPPTPEVVEQPVAAAADPVDAETPAGYAVGDLLRNITPSQVNIRRVPGYLSKPDGDVVAQIGPGDQVELLGGRASADNLTWWYIRYTTPGNQAIEGWIADATASGVQILGR